MRYQQQIDAMSPQIYQRLLRAVELGRWPDGSALTAEQRANALQAVIAWGERHLPPDQRVGHLESPRTSATPCDTAATRPLRWRE